MKAEAPGPFSSPPPTLPGSNYILPGESRGGRGGGGVRRGGMKVKVRDWETGPAAPQ